VTSIQQFQSPVVAPSAAAAVAVVPAASLGLAARAHHRLIRLRDEERGQGTVEYVALAMLIAAVMAGVVVAAGGLKGGGIAQAVIEKVKSTITATGKK
jgi:Flp pilus assembly pilin Flp